MVSPYPLSMVYPYPPYPLIIPLAGVTAGEGRGVEATFLPAFMLFTFESTQTPRHEMS